MTSNLVTRRELSARLLGILPALGFITKARALTATASSPADNGISRTCECIHQEVAFKASRARVYQALTDAKQFSKVTDFSIPGASTTISPQVGGSFSLFGGVISGRHIEMIPNERLVQAWRAAEWARGVYSIARFQLNEAGAGTSLVFDHTGFPQGKAESLADGWKSHYWAPLQKYLS
ncbi:MAG: SRPBCC domain-containing protein [Candidatus Sulfotelmatobacter sp.]